MAVSELPTDETIDNFLAIVGHLDRGRAIRILQFHNNGVEQAINDYFDDPGSSKYDRPPPISQNQHWDENAFNSNRDGSTNNAGISFTIEGNDEYPPQYNTAFDGAPSRPPSRTSNNKSPHHGKIIDLSSDHATLSGNQSPIMGYNPNDANDDPELREALAASMLPPQESGVAFGPATRPQYEQGKWDLVPTTSYREILLDPEPIDRKRELCTPAFLKPSVDDHRLGFLLTIYHEIPVLRELFLDRSNVVTNYGNDREWWTGKAMEVPMVSGSEEIDRADFRHELQRLMAFLDKTDRSYGSAEALANLALVKRWLRSVKDVESAVLESFKDITQNESKTKKLFSRGVNGPEELASQEFAILQLPLPPKESLFETLYDISDDVMWEASSFDINNSPYLTHIAEVITFRFTDWDESKKKGVIVPAVWYPDRYLETGRQAALDMRMKKQEVINKLKNFDHLENGLLNYETRLGRNIKIKDLFDAALQHDQDELEMENGMDLNGAEDNLATLETPNKNKGLSAQLRKVLETIDLKLNALKDQREKAKDELRELSKLYTQQTETQDQPPLHKYTLRGVSTSKSTVYVCRQAVPDLIDIDLESESSESTNDQWWKIHYAISDSKPVNVEQTTEDIVLKAASESSSSILVYANEKAMRWQSRPLPIPLETFVRKDNVWFKNELPPADSPVSSPISPTSPGKRKTEASEAADEALQDFRYKGNTKTSEDSTEDTTSNGARQVSELSDSSTQPIVNGDSGMEVIEGVNPKNHETSSSGQEMQERGSMLMLAAQNGTEKSKPIDLMDMDQVMEDANIAQESGAVKRVGFTD